MMISDYGLQVEISLQWDREEVQLAQKPRVGAFLAEGLAAIALGYSSNCYPHQKSSPAASRKVLVNLRMIEGKKAERKQTTENGRDRYIKINRSTYSKSRK
jgi:hypothetical protein